MLQTHSRAGGVTFHRGWSEKYGFHVAESLAVLSASLFAFAWIAESYVANASLNRWDARFNEWLNHEAWPPLVRLFETFTIPGSVVFLVAATAAAAMLLAARRNFADATLLVAAFSGASLAPRSDAAWLTMALGVRLAIGEAQRARWTATTARHRAPSVPGQC